MYNDVIIYEPEYMNMQLYAAKISFLECLSSTYMLGKEKRKKKKIKEEREKKLRWPIIKDYLAANLFGRQILYKLMFYN